MTYPSRARRDAADRDPVRVESSGRRVDRPRVTSSSPTLTDSCLRDLVEDSAPRRCSGERRRTRSCGGRSPGHDSACRSAASTTAVSGRCSMTSPTRPSPLTTGEPIRTPRDEPAGSRACGERAADDEMTRAVMAR